jgi:hypothetical protein
MFYRDNDLTSQKENSRAEIQDIDSQMFKEADSSSPIHLTKTTFYHSHHNFIEAA